MPPNSPPPPYSIRRALYHIVGALSNARDAISGAAVNHTDPREVAAGETEAAEEIATEEGQPTSPKVAMNRNIFERHRDENAEFPPHRKRGAGD